MWKGSGGGWGGVLVRRGERPDGLCVQWLARWGWAGWRERRGGGGPARWWNDDGGVGQIAGVLTHGLEAQSSVHELPDV